MVNISRKKRKRERKEGLDRERKNSREMRERAHTLKRTESLTFGVESGFVLKGI